MVQGHGVLGLVLHGSCYWALGEARIHVRVWSPAPSQSYPENPMQHQRSPLLIKLNLQIKNKHTHIWESKL
jgi:hypothetical protein